MRLTFKLVVWVKQSTLPNVDRLFNWSKPLILPKGQLSSEGDWLPLDSDFTTTCVLPGWHPRSAALLGLLDWDMLSLRCPEHQGWIDDEFTAHKKGWCRALPLSLRTEHMKLNKITHGKKQDRSSEPEAELWDPWLMSGQRKQTSKKLIREVPRAVILLNLQKTWDSWVRNKGFVRLKSEKKTRNKGFVTDNSSNGQAAAFFFLHCFPTCHSHWVVLENTSSFFQKEMIKELCTHVCKWKSNTYWNYSRNGGKGRWMMKGVNSTMI
jgi:hypothetical protein